MINENEFNSLLNEVIDKKDKIIVLYSGLWSFINNISFRIKDKKKIPNKILEILEKKIGKNKTLFIPAFTGKIFKKTGYIQLDKDIDKENGYLSIVATKKNYYRTKQPIHSYFVIGKNKQIKKLKLKSSWGKYSLLEYFSKKNARICALGVPWNIGCAYLHRFEEIYNVPWRYQKKFISKFYLKRKYIGKFSEIKFCSPEKCSLNYDFKPFIKYIEKSKSFKKSSSDKIKLESIKTKCLDEIGDKIFKKNPWTIVKNKKKIKNWIKNDKYKEIKLYNSLI